MGRQATRNPTLFRSGVVDLDHGADISAGEFKLGNDRRPQQPALLPGALDKFPQLVLELVDGRFCDLQFSHVSQPSIGRDSKHPAKFEGLPASQAPTKAQAA